MIPCLPRSIVFSSFKGDIPSFKGDIPSFKFKLPSFKFKLPSFKFKFPSFNIQLPFRRKASSNQAPKNTISEVALPILSQFLPLPPRSSSPSSLSSTFPASPTMTSPASPARTFSTFPTMTSSASPRSSLPTLSLSPRSSELSSLLPFLQDSTASCSPSFQEAASFLKGRFKQLWEQNPQAMVNLRNKLTKEALQQYYAYIQEHTEEKIPSFEDALPTLMEIFDAHEFSDQSIKSTNAWLMKHAEETHKRAQSFAPSKERSTSKLELSDRESLARLVSYVIPKDVKTGTIIPYFDSKENRIIYYQINNQLHEDGLHAYLLTPLFEKDKDRPAKLLFRGTDDARSARRDVSLSKRLEAKIGQTEFKDHFPKIFPWLKEIKFLEIIGHSLGGCDGQRATLYLIENKQNTALEALSLFVYCAPKLNKSAYSRPLKLEDGKGLRLKLFFISHKKDIVPDFGFRHLSLLHAHAKELYEKTKGEKQFLLQVLQEKNYNKTDIDYLRKLLKKPGFYLYSHHPLTEKQIYKILVFLTRKNETYKERNIILENSPQTSKPRGHGDAHVIPFFSRVPGFFRDSLQPRRLPL